MCGLGLRLPNENVLNPIGIGKVCPRSLQTGTALVEQALPENVLGSWLPELEEEQPKSSARFAVQRCECMDATRRRTSKIAFNLTGVELGKAHPADVF